MCESGCGRGCVERERQREDDREGRVGVEGAARGL